MSIQSTGDDLTYDWGCDGSQLLAGVFKDPLSDVVDELWVDHASGLAEAELQTLDIVWAPTKLDARVEDSVFGLRRWMQSNDSAAYASFSPPTPDRVSAPAFVDASDPWR